MSDRASGPAPGAPRWRYERFGAIIALDDPPILAHVDRELATDLGRRDARQPYQLATDQHCRRPCFRVNGGIATH